MNSMIEDLIIRVLSVEDIPADVATELITLFNLIVKRAPQIFPVSLQKNIIFFINSFLISFIK